MKGKLICLVLAFTAGLPAVAQDRPSVRLGDLGRIELKARVQADLRALSPDFETKQGRFDITRARLGVEGDFLRHLQYEAEYDFRESDYPWRDVYVNFRYFDDFQVKAGKFKIPFSREQLTSVSSLEFADRSRVADELAPARDLGVMLHGRFFNRGLGYEAGVFRNDGENSDAASSVREVYDRARTGRGDTTWALRLTGRPLRLLSLPDDWDEVELGVAAASTNVPESFGSLRGRTVTGETFFPHVHVNGRRFRLGAEVDWRPGPFSVQSEFIHVSEQRQGQSVRMTDLPDKISRGWYLTGTWAITGESRQNGIEPRRPLFSEGFGAIELAARYEKLWFRSDETQGLAFRSPRAANLTGNSDRAWTVGVNWYLNRYARIQFNSIRETIDDAERSPIPGRSRFWTGVVRLQFAM